MSPELRLKRLSRLRLAILTTLWTKEMYGLEIQRRLKVMGISVGVGQLYPELNYLVEQKALISREEKNNSRKFYHTSEKGKELVKYYMADIFIFFENIIEERLTFLLDEFNKLITIKSGMVGCDLSRIPYETVLREIAGKTSPTGRLFLLSPHKEMTNLFNNRIEYYNIENVASVLEYEKDSKIIPLNPQSIDFAILTFTLHEDDTEWLITEMARILKPTGRGIIIDSIEAPQENIIIEILLEFLPDHSKTGIILEECRELFNMKQLEILEERIVDHFVFWLVKPK
jgi:DNA-binding PadR family transcriptional regulator